MVSERDGEQIGVWMRQFERKAPFCSRRQCATHGSDMGLAVGLAMGLAMGLAAAGSSAGLARGWRRGAHLLEQRLGLLHRLPAPELNVLVVGQAEDDVRAALADRGERRRRGPGGAVGLDALRGAQSEAVRAI